MPAKSNNNSKRKPNPQAGERAKWIVFFSFFFVASTTLLFGIRQFMGHGKGEGNIVTVTEANFSAEVLKSPLPVLVDFWAPWCGPCKALAPTVHELATEYQGRIKVAKLNVDDNKELAEKYGISGIPNLMLFKDGQVKDQTMGLQSKENLKAMLDRVAGQTVSTPSQPSGTASATAAPATSGELPTLEINTAVMVTEELDFGANIPSIADALKQIERHYEPDDHVGRTFAVLDAYGEPTADHKLHISMHVSAEKPGIASLIFRPTGKVLWKNRIVMGSKKEVTPLNKRTLLILVDTGTHTNSFTIDGSNNPASILDANVKEAGIPLNMIWPDQTEREFTYVYSACGCPVKALVRRVGDRTERVKELPVMFPDDPAALDVISRLMRWKG